MTIDPKSPQSSQSARNLTTPERMLLIVVACVAAIGLIALSVALPGGVTVAVLLKLLDWPFLSFLLILIAVLIFRKQLVAILGRGDIAITWGDRNIRLRELSASLDEELDPIRDDIQTIKDAVAAIEATYRVPDAPPMEPVSNSGLTADQRSQAHLRIRQALADGEYRWRTVERLAVIGGVSEKDAMNLLRADEQVVLSRGKSGQRIARLASRTA